MDKAKVFGGIVGLSTICATLLAIVFFGLSAKRPVVHAQADDESTTTGCTLATIKGNYGFEGSGIDTQVGGPYARVGLFEPNGAGKFALHFTQNYDGKISSYSFSGPYTVSSNCTGTIAFKSGGPTYTLSYVVVTSGNEIDFASTTAGLVETWVAKKIN